MHADTHLAAFEDEAERFRAALSQGVTAPVPSCPGWSVGDLALHLGGIHRWAAEIVRTRATEPIRRRDLAVTIEPTDPAIDRWFADGASALGETLAACPPDAPVWSWVADQTAGFWRRRQAHETAMHRWDIEAAHGDAQPIDAALASDGIDEWFDVFAAGRLRGLSTREGAGESLHLHCTDTEGEWVVRFDGPGIDVHRAHEKGDVAIRGAASDLLLFLWGRASADPLEILGDRALADAWTEFLPRS